MNSDGLTYVISIDVVAPPVNYIKFFFICTITKIQKLDLCVYGLFNSYEWDFLINFEWEKTVVFDDKSIFLDFQNTLSKGSLSSKIISLL